jgi:hypothetical protein
MGQAGSSPTGMPSLQPEAWPSMCPALNAFPVQNIGGVGCEG